MFLQSYTAVLHPVYALHNTSNLPASQHMLHVLFPAWQWMSLVLLLLLITTVLSSLQIQPQTTLLGNKGQGKRQSSILL